MTGPRSIALGLKRGLLQRCPNCGQGKLYRRYLKVQACDVCGQDNTLYPADDAPPYFTILIVGHIVVAPLLCFPVIWTAPTGLVLAVVMPTLAALTLTLLPSVKGAVVGVLWALEGRAEPKPTI
jgi:uncharacterized protein (DUF983 family)